MYAYDLHLHSYYSDGADAPKEIIQKARGMKAIAITDHDTDTVNEELISYAESFGIQLIRGMEMSCVDPETNRKVHLLVYFHGAHPHTMKLCEDFKERATKSREKMAEALNVPLDIVRKYQHGALYKQHIALAMQEMGYGEYADIFPRYFRGPNSLEKEYPVTFIDIFDALKAANQDHAIAVLAHPASYNSFDRIPAYIQHGLTGIEISHPSYQEGDLEKVLPYDLLHTGGSDYHGQYNLSAKRQIGNYGINREDFEKFMEAYR